MVNKWLIINTLRNEQIFTRTMQNIVIDTSSICSGRFSVTARCHVDGSPEDRLIKCYLQRSHRVKTIYGEQYHYRELGIFKLDGTIEYIDVVITNWVNGIPLNEYMEDPDVDHRTLSHNFDTLAYNTLTSDHTHSDIKPDNIIVRPDESMELIDNDALWSETIAAKLRRKRTTPPSNRIVRYERPSPKSLECYKLALVSTMLAAMAYKFDDVIGFVKTDIFFEESKSQKFMRAIERCRTIFEQAGDKDHLAISEIITAQDMLYPYDVLYYHYRSILGYRL